MKQQEAFEQYSNEFFFHHINIFICSHSHDPFQSLLLIYLKSCDQQIKVSPDQKHVLIS